MKYYFKPDWFVICISIIVLGAIGMLINIIQWNSLGSAIFFLLMIGILLYGLAIMPIWVQIDEDIIKVQQLFGCRTYNKKKVKLKPISKQDLKGSIRVFGSSGYGGYTGWFRNKRMGKFFMLILNKEEIVLIETEKGKKVVINYPQSLLK